MDEIASRLWQDEEIGIADERTDEALSYIDRYYSAPRVFELVEAFLRRDLPAGRALVYGAGSATRQILPILADRSDIEIVAIIDQLAATIGSFAELPVVAPEAVPGMAFDYILVPHTEREGEMMRRLLALGVPEDKLIPIYANPAYRRRAADWLDAAVREATKRKVDYVVITSTNDTILPLARLTTYLPAERTAHLYMWRPETFTEGSPYDVVMGHQSVELMMRLLHAWRPRVVYLASWIATEHLFVALRAGLPETAVLHELYDFTTFFNDGVLTLYLGLDRTTIRLARYAEYLTLRQTDLVVSKRGGPGWQSIEAFCPGRYALFFPMLKGPAAAVPPVTDHSISLVYAGTLPASDRLEIIDGYNFMPVIEAICAKGDITATIFNGTHRRVEEDAMFADYLTRYETGNVQYNRRIAFEDLRHRLAGFHYGWLAGETNREYQPERIVTLSNTFAGYAAVGLPVILDAGWIFAAQLVREFDAGIVVEGNDPNVIAAAIRTADHAAHRAGMARLLDHLLARNGMALDQIGALVERASALSAT
jgi:hypothetical protein